MARERIENGSVTSLNGTINDSTTTVAVADAGVLSPLPQFRIIIDSEIMLVTGIAGNNLTVTRGAEGSTAAAHTDGATVAQIITRDGIRAYMRQQVDPYFDDPNRYPMEMRDVSDNLLTAANFNWVNQGVTTAVDQSSGPIYFNWLQNANNYVAYQRTLTAPYKVTAKFLPHWPTSASSPSFGMCIRDNTTNEAITTVFETEGLSVQKWNNLTSFGSTAVAAQKFGLHGWFQMEDDNVDIFCRTSRDGVNFETVFQEARTTFITTPDRVGVFMNTFNSGTQEQAGSLVAWIEE